MKTATPIGHKSEARFHRDGNCIRSVGDVFRPAAAFDAQRGILRGHGGVWVRGDSSCWRFTSKREASLAMEGLAAAGFRVSDSPVPEPPCHPKPPASTPTRIDISLGPVTITIRLKN